MTYDPINRPHQRGMKWGDDRQRHYIHERRKKLRRDNDM